MLSDNTVRQIINRADIVEVIKLFIKLRKKGNIYVGLCPYHNGTTNSLVVSSHKEIFKCFDCGRSGNVVNFIMDQQKCTFKEALIWLAQKYKLDVVETTV